MLFSTSSSARRSAQACVVLALSLGSFGCKEEDPAPLFIDVDYQLRCIDCEPRSADSPVRELALLDGEQDSTFNCSVDEIGGRRLLTFELNGPTYGLTLRQVDIDSGEPGSQCVVSVNEGSANQYEGRCKAPGEDGAAPCEVSLQDEGGIITGEVYCERIQHRTTSEYTRYLVKSGTMEPARFELQGCRGL